MIKNFHRESFERHWNFYVSYTVESCSATLRAPSDKDVFQHEIKVKYIYLVSEEDGFLLKLSDFLPAPEL